MEVYLVKDMHLALFFKQRNAALVLIKKQFKNKKRKFMQILKNNLHIAADYGWNSYCYSEACQ
jgi:hypothetical protein